MNTDKLARNNQKLDAAMPAPSPIETNQTREQYAAALGARFQAYVDWAIGHWPVNETPLNAASFNRSRDELNAICRALDIPLQESDPDKPGAAQFIPVAPMPWP